MMGVSELLRQPFGRDVLAEYDIITDEGSFLARLSPRASHLTDSTHEAGALPVYVHQQPCPDYGASVVAKFETLAALRKGPGAAIRPVFVAIDTDRAASAKSATRLAWREADGQTVTFKLAPPGTKYREFRHIRTEPAQLMTAAAQLAARVMRTEAPGAMARLEDIMPLLAPEEPVAYGQYAGDLAQFLIGRRTGVAPEQMFVSTLQQHSSVIGMVAKLLEAIDDFISAFNRQIGRLRAMDVDTAVGPLADEYLPLFHTCPLDGERTRLRRRTSGGEWRAEAGTRAGRWYRFPLDSRASIEEMFASGRVSVDVTLPVLLSPVFSGLVAGRSSALYCMVMRGAMMEALGEKMTPILVPSSLADRALDPLGLMQRWLVEGDA